MPVAYAARCTADGHTFSRAAMSRTAASMPGEVRVAACASGPRAAGPCPDGPCAVPARRSGQSSSRSLRRARRRRANGSVGSSGTVCSQCRSAAARSTGAIAASAAARSAGCCTTGGNCALRRLPRDSRSAPNSRWNRASPQSSKVMWCSTTASRRGAPAVVTAQTRIGQSRSRSKGARLSPAITSAGPGLPSASVVAVCSGSGRGGCTTCRGPEGPAGSTTVRRPS